MFNITLLDILNPISELTITVASSPSIITSLSIEVKSNGKLSTVTVPLIITLLDFVLFLLNHFLTAVTVLKEPSSDQINELLSFWLVINFLASSNT